MRKLAYLILIFSFTFSNSILAAETKQNSNDENYYDFGVQKEYYENLRRAQKQKTANIPSDNSQYKGDFPDSWYKKYKYKKNYYMTFDVGYNIAPSASDVKNTEIHYKDGICRTAGGCAADQYLYSPGRTIQMDDDTLVDISYDGSLNVAAYFGISYSDRYRIEAQLSYKQLGYSEITQSPEAIANYDALDSGAYDEPGPTVDTDQDITLKMTSLMVNFYRDFNRDGTYRPYIGVGVGGTNVATTGTEGISFTYQVKLGMSYRLRENMFVDFGATYFDLGDVNYKYSIDNENTSVTSSETVQYTMEHPLNYFALAVGYRFLFDASH